ncbi:MAG: nucleotide exchange factor GrpE [Candidatus Kerfeldbacteria bacterium]|nr:nucleotide exchange factor GrpE [Candidatus Kerfeldbacteria bacterium]
MTNQNDSYNPEHDPDNIPEVLEPNEEPQEEPVALTKEQEYLLGWQRCQADYQNLQKETARRIQEHTKYATEGLLEELLPLVDYFKFAFNGVPEAEKSSSWLKGVEHIQTNLLNILRNNNVEMMEVVGKAFDANLHDAVAEVESSKESGTIVEEVTPGFTLNGKVIRHAKVKVAK